MKTKGLLARTAVGAVGAIMLTGIAGVAIADEITNDEVDVNVNIEALPPVGALTMTVAANSTALEEVPSGDPEIRQFDGTLPTVTITDDREEVPESVYWYVTGQSSAFTGPAGTTPLPAGHLGWVPAVTNAEGDGEVAAGDEVVTVLDESTTGTGPSANNVGLVGEELLALALDSGEAAAAGSWSATADLFLKTPVNVAPGAYSATITLTLWEDAQ